MLRSLRALLIVAACMAPAPRVSADSVPLRLHLAGDSTMSDKRPERRPETGWGEALAGLFEPGSVLIINHARNGRSTRTFIEEGRWAALLKSAAPGDHVFLQFGHNDASENKPDRYTPLPDYRGNLQRFVREARAAGLQPLLLTPVARRRFDEAGHPQPSHGAYPDAVRALALELDVPMIDAERLSEALLKRAGPEASKHLFLHLPADAHPNYPGGLQDDTHFSPAGAAAVATEIAAALRAQTHPLSRHLQAEGQ
jgi:lysophospholipase L1-like esterase